MKAVVLRATPDGGVFEVADVPKPELEPGKVLVKVRAAGVNRGELITQKNYRAGPAIINGIEFVGEVVACGEGVTQFALGAPVMGHGRQSMAEYVQVDPRALMPTPEGLGVLQAAAFPNVFITSHNAIVTAGGLKAGERVIVNAASSGIGTASVQVARVMKAGAVIAVSRTREKAERLRPLGATHVVGVEEEALETAVAAATSDAGGDLFIDSLGAPYLAANLRALALEGRLVSVGRTAGTTSELDLDYLSLRRLKIIGVTFRTRTPEEALRCVEACARDLLPALAAGEIRPVVDSDFPIERIAEAHRRLASNEQFGKIVVTLD